MEVLPKCITDRVYEDYTGIFALNDDLAAL